MTAAYWRLIDELIEDGEQVAPRGIATRELIGYQFKLTDPSNNLPVNTNRKLNAKIAYAEGLQLVAGRSFPELMVKIAPNFKAFTNGGTWFHGAYGPRIRTQIGRAIAQLQADPSSRQALVTIWDPAYDGYTGVNDTPCTVALQFFIRDNRLEMVTTMRSNDVWWGTPYDVFQFTFLQIHVAHSLGVKLGTYTHQAGSFHIYERDIEAAAQVTHSKSTVQTKPISIDDRWHVIQEVAEAILADRDHPWMSSAGTYMREKLHAF